jgi:hypothetical protein
MMVFMVFARSASQSTYVGIPEAPSDARVCSPQACPAIRPPPALISQLVRIKPCLDLVQGAAQRRKIGKKRCELLNCSGFLRLVLQQQARDHTTIRAATLVMQPIEALSKRLAIGRWSKRRLTFRGSASCATSVMTNSECKGKMS